MRGTNYKWLLWESETTVKPMSLLFQQSRVYQKLISFACPYCSSFSLTWWYWISSLRNYHHPENYHSHLLHQSFLNQKIQAKLYYLQISPQPSHMTTTVWTVEQKKAEKLCVSVSWSVHILLINSRICHQKPLPTMISTGGLQQMRPW